MKLVLLGATVVTVAVSGVGTRAQFSPYRLVANWAQLPAGMKWGGVGGMSFDAQGNLWVTHRGEQAILEFDPSGKFLKGFGKGDDFIMLHGSAIDQGGNVWIADTVGPTRERNPAMRSRKGGFQVFKFSPDGKLLMTLGKAGVQGASSDTFIAPAGVAIAPNGDVFVPDGHGAREGMQDGDRVVKYSKDGKFIKSIGRKGTKPGEFWGPHGIAIDSKGRVLVAERYNSRIQVLDQDGNTLDIWRQFGRPAGIAIGKGDIIYVTSDQSGPGGEGYPVGLFIGDAQNGQVLGFMSGEMGETIAVDAQGNVYVGQPGGGVAKYVKRW